MKNRVFLLPLLAALCIGLTGCTKPLKVKFAAPSGSTMTYGDKQYVLPAVVELQRPHEKGKELRRDVSFVFNAADDKKLEATGVIETFAYDETDVDRFATNNCAIGPDEIKKLSDGFAVVIKGISASEQMIYRLTMGSKH